MQDGFDESNPYVVIMRKNSFYYWFGFGAPVFFGVALLCAFSASLLSGVLFMLVLVLRVWDSFRTTCSRCGNYGKSNCGLPGLVVSKLYKFNFQPISPKRIRLHLLMDYFVIFVALYFLWNAFLWLFLISLIWPIGAWLVSFGPRQYHGLMHRLPHQSTKLRSFFARLG